MLLGDHFYTTSLEELVQYVIRCTQTSFSKDYIEILGQFDKIAQKHFDTN